MLETGGGAIVNNASVDGKRAYPFPGGAAYAAAKHGVLGLARSAALEYIGDGSRINAVCLPHPPAANGPFGSRYTTRPWNSVIWQSMSFSASVSTL